MKNNVAVSIGSVALIEKVDGEFGFFRQIFTGVGGKAKNLISSTKLYIYNRLDECFSINRILSGYSSELFELLKFKQNPSERDLYRNLSRLGNNHIFILNNYQQFICNENLAADKQFVDFSSSYFEGKHADFGALGYSRDHEPGKKQLTFGISTGINGIPTALTIQNGNVQDKAHFRFMLKTSEAVLPLESLLIFDTGGNTKENKRDIRERKFHYLTLKAKKVAVYKKFIEQYHRGKKEEVVISGVKYSCVKIIVDREVNYIFFCEKLKQEQLALKERNFKKMLEKNKSILKKTKAGKTIDELITEEGIITTKGTLQQTLAEIENPRINGLEGFFILESDLDIEPERALALYKDKDKAEKLFRSIKEGTELRPMRHWSKDAIIGYILVIFLTNFLINLTLLRAKNSVVKNTKLLKKYLRKLTLVIIYPPVGFRFQVLANICPEVEAFLGDFIKKYREKELPNRW
jgi:transposase